MRRHWLLLALVLAVSSVAHARSPVRLRMSMTATIEPGLHAGRLRLAFADDVALDFDELRVELRSATSTHALTFSHGTYMGPIDLDPYTRDLPRGTYDVAVTWQSPTLRAVTYATTMLPYHCGLYYARAAEVEPPPAPEPNTLPYGLGLSITVLLVGAAIAKRAGTAGTHVPCSAP